MQYGFAKTLYPVLPALLSIGAGQAWLRSPIPRLLLIL
jgi:hypothetical protein